MDSKRTGRRAGFIVLSAAALLALAPPLPAQPAAPPAAAADTWGVLRQLVGSWQGEIEGSLGTGRGVRRYELIMGERFLLVRHRSVRLPQEKSPRGDEHQELNLFSYDRERKTIVYREFFGEGVVVRSPCRVDGSKVVCVSEAVENGAGIRARLTLEITDRYRFTETYELLLPNQKSGHSFTNRWTRSPVPYDLD